MPFAPQSGDSEPNLRKLTKARTAYSCLELRELDPVGPTEFACGIGHGHYISVRKAHGPAAVR